MNRTDRLLAIVLELQARGWARAEDLAGVFEVSKRTIYRDIDALGESGVPVIAQAGRGYALDADYFLPPLQFTPDEAILLRLGADFMVQQFDAQYQVAAHSAAQKISVVLPERLREQVRELETTLRFITPAGNIPTETLQRVRRAIVTRHTLRFRYQSRSGDEAAGEQTMRDADPFALINYDNAWMLVAYCHLRRDERRFRLDRMTDVEVLPRGFTPPADFHLEENMDDRQIVVRVCFAPEMARWVREARNYYTINEQDTAEGYLVTLRVRREIDVLRWILGWGSDAIVLEPASLRQRIMDQARSMLAQADLT